MTAAHRVLEQAAAAPLGPGRAGRAAGVAVAPGEVRAGPRVRIALADGSLATFVGFHGMQSQVSNGSGPRAEHFAVLFDAPDPTPPPCEPLVRMHSECITGDLFGSLRCDCGPQLQQSLALLKAHGGILLYLRQEGRGIGLAAKLEAYGLQDLGMDTYAANRALSQPADAREYACGAAMLHALGVAQVRLITNNPDKASQLRRHGIRIAQVMATGTFSNPHNHGYLAAKALLTGHTLSVRAGI